MRTEKTLIRKVVELEQGSIVFVVRVRLFDDNNVIVREWTEDTADGLTFDVDHRDLVVENAKLVESHDAAAVAAKLGLTEISVPDLVGIVDQKIADKAEAAAVAEAAELAAELAKTEQPTEEIAE